MILGDGSDDAWREMARIAKRSMITLIAMKKRAKLIRFLLFAFVLMPVVANAGAKNPLLPVDTSSPRATMQSFLALTEEATDRYQAYRDAPSRDTQQALLQVALKAERLFDLREVAPANRLQVADRTFYLLWEVIARQRLPKLTDIPAAVEQDAGGEPDEPPSRWRLPGTEITIARVTEGPYSGEYQFSPTTVAQVPDFYDRVRDLPYRQPMGIKNAARIDELFTGWMIPVAMGGIATGLGKRQRQGPGILEMGGGCSVDRVGVPDRNCHLPMGTQKRIRWFFSLFSALYERADSIPFIDSRYRLLRLSADSH